MPKRAATSTRASHALRAGRRGVTAHWSTSARRATTYAGCSAAATRPDPPRSTSTTRPPHSEPTPVGRGACAISAALTRLRARPLTWVQANRRPPRATFEYALLKTAAGRGEGDAIALLSDAVHQGLTTPSRLLAVIAQLPRLPRRALLAEVLADVAAGTRSVLEQRYLRDVERAHGLPEGERSCGRTRPAAPCTATSATAPSGPSSSSTERSATATPSTDGQTFDVTSTLRSTTTSRCVPAGRRCSSRVGSPTWSRPCCATVGGPAARGPAARSAPSTVERSDGPSVAGLHCCEAAAPSDSTRSARRCPPRRRLSRA